MLTFRKRYAKKKVPFTQTSPQTGQVITSCGNPSLDVLLGGGMPTGSICLIEEDKFATFSKVLAKYFMAEGICSEQSLFLGSLDDCPLEMLLNLPKPLYQRNVDEYQPEENSLRIAWRYNDFPLVTSEKANTPIGHHFNLMQPMDQEAAMNADTVLWNNEQTDNDKTSNQPDDDGEEIEVAHYNNGNDATYVMDASKDANLESSNNAASSNSSSLPTPPPPICKQPANADIFENQKYSSLLKDMQQMLGANKFQYHSGDFLVMKSLCRVCLTSLGSPLWYEDNFGKDLLKFLTILRAAIRSSVSVCFITMPMHLVAKYDASLVSKIRNLVDFSIELESFSGSDKQTNPAFKNYHGLIHLRKITAINTLSAYIPETTDLAFQLRRASFIIEKLHLPPEVQDETGTPTESQPTLSCGSNTSANPNISLDF